MLSGINFTSVLLLGFGAALLVLSGLLCLAVMMHSGTARKITSWSGGGWNVIAQWPAMNATRSAVFWIDDFINKSVAKMILDYERSQVFGAIATFIFIIILPLAALVNTLQGGSPFMLYCYGFICFGVAYQLFTAESRLNAGLRTVIAGASAFLLVFALPYYAAYALTEHLMNRGILISVVASICVSNVLYAGTAGLGALVRSGNRSEDLPLRDTFIAYLLFAIPIYYIIYWLILFIGHVAYDQTVGLHDWQSLLVSVGLGAASFACMKFLLDAVKRKSGFLRTLFCLVAGSVSLVLSAYFIDVFSYPDSNAFAEQGRYWLMHLPFVPAFLVFCFVIFSVFARYLLLINPLLRFVKAYPFVALNLMLGLVGAITICLALVIN